MSDKFLNTGGSGNADISNGTINAYIASLTIANLKASMPLKTNSVNTLVSTKLDISDINTLESRLGDSKGITNPYVGKLQATDFETDDYFSVNTALQTVDNFTASTATDTNITGILKVPEVATGRLYDSTKSTWLELDGATVDVQANSITGSGTLGTAALPWSSANLTALNVDHVITNLITAPGSPPVVIGGADSKITVNNSAIQVDCLYSVGLNAVNLNIDAAVIPSSTATLGTAANPWLSSHINDLDITGELTSATIKLLSTEIALGLNAGITTQGTNSVAIGKDAGQTTQGTNAIALGINAGNANQGINSVAVGINAGKTTQGANSVALGNGAGVTTQGESSVAVGLGAGNGSQGANSVAVGINAGNDTQSTNSVAIGTGAGLTTQGTLSVAVGYQAGRDNQGTNAVAVGNVAGETAQGNYSIAVGLNAGYTTQGTNSVAVGRDAGKTGQGANSVAIGRLAGQTNQPANSTVINASGNALNGANTSALYIDPIRNITDPVKCMNYNPTSKEVTYTNMGNYLEASSTSDSTVTSTTAADIGGMVLSPPVGTYMATFSCWFENDIAYSDDGIQVAIYENSTIVSHSIRKNWTGEAGKYETSFHTQAIVTVTSGDTIRVKASLLGTKNIRVANRSLILVSLGVTAT